jgi:hypothetical protein
MFTAQITLQFDPAMIMFLALHAWIQWPAIARQPPSPRRKRRRGQE